MRLLVFFTFLFLAPAAAQDRPQGRASFQFPMKDVWAAVMETLAEENIRPHLVERDSGVIFLEGAAAWGNRWGSANAAVRLFSSKEVGSLATWQGIALAGTILCKPLSETETEVRVTLRLSGCNAWAAIGTPGTSCQWEELPSNGFLEDRLLKWIAHRLQPGSVPAPGAVNPKVERGLLGVYSKAIGKWPIYCERAEVARIHRGRFVGMELEPGRLLVERRQGFLDPGEYHRFERPVRQA